MKQKIIILAVLVVLCIGTLTMTCMATSSAESALKKDQAYNLSLTGSKCRVTAMGTIGTTPKCYTSMVNTSNESIIATIWVKEIDLISGESTGKSKSNVVVASSGTLVTKSLTRQPDNDKVKYEHYGKACKYTDPNVIYDELVYYIDQVE